MSGSRRLPLDACFAYQAPRRVIETASIADRIARKGTVFRAIGTVVEAVGWKKSSMALRAEDMPRRPCRSVGCTAAKCSYFFHR